MKILCVAKFWQTQRFSLHCENRDMSMSKKKKLEESNGGIDYQDCWNMDVRLAGMICTNLQAFLQAVKAGPQGYPGVLDDEYGKEKGFNEWLRIIRKMIFAFDQYVITKWQPEKDSETQERIKEGMELFIRYFNYLWI